MDILPVLDLQQGAVVRGVAGQRDAYRPITSPLITNPSPRAVARALANTFALQEFYLADLDAIAGAEPAWDIYDALNADGRSLWVDAGISRVERCQQLMNYSHSGKQLAAIVAGLESLATPALLDDCLALCGPERLVFSLDLKQGMPLATPGWQQWSALQIAVHAVQRGIRRIIVLDLSNVGVNQGVSTLALCRELKQNCRHLQLIAGGGVRDRADLEKLAAAGCDIALVASALHDGRLTSDDLVQISQL